MPENVVQMHFELYQSWCSDHLPAESVLVLDQSVFEVPDSSEALPRNQGFHPVLQMLPVVLLFITGMP